MGESGLDLFLCAKKENIFYLCGFNGSSSILLVGNENALLITDGRYKTQAAQEVKGAEVEITREELLPVAGEKALAMGAIRLGFEAESFSYNKYQVLLEKVGQDKIRPTSRLVEKLRIVKQPEEIAAIREACLCVEKAIHRAIAEVKEKMTEKDLAAEIDYSSNKLGARKPAFDTIVAFAENAALPHATPQSRPLARGDAILVDCGALWEGYCSDITRTFFFGKPGEKATQAYKAVLASQELALEALQSGKKASEIDSVARESLEKAGFAQFFNHSLGHGVGIEIHEAPQLSWKDDTVLAEGMVVTVEPGVYFEGLFGIRIEDSAVVRKGQAEVLTSFPKALEEIIL
jgi:Xaa-Pro aminopeptidase